MDKAFLSNRLPYQNHKLTQAEVLEAFATDAKQIIPALISELTNRRKMLVTHIGDAVTLINAESEDEAFRYYWTLWLALNEGEELQVLNAKLARHHRMLSTIDGKPAPVGRLHGGCY